MSRALRLVAAVAVLATAGLTTAQSPTTPGTDPTQPGTTPSTPVQAPAAPATPVTPTMPAAPANPAMPVPTVTDGVQPMPSGRSTWRSQDGSVVDLTVDSVAGTLTGTFTPGFPCGFASTLMTAARPIVGTVNGNAIAWTLSLSACPSVGTWVGHFQTTGTEDQLVMLFTLAVPESPPGVGSTLTGAAVFVKQTAGATP